MWSSLVEGRLYYCSDETGFGYFHPGDWVHDPIVSEDFSERTGSMEDPDLIREGWSESLLWVLWSGTLGLTIILSALFSRYGFDLFEADTSGVKTSHSERGNVPNP